jgi:hypothetical protein
LAPNAFQTFLKSQEWDYHVSRYFVDHAITDKQLPDAKSWEELRDYISKRNPDASPKTLEGAKYAWGRYVNSTRAPEEE